MRGNESFEKFCFARGVLAVADENDRLASGFVRELFLACQVDRVVHRCTAADLQIIDGGFEQSWPVGKVLDERDGPIKADHKCKIVRFQYRLKKALGRVFLFLENRANARAG